MILITKTSDVCVCVFFTIPFTAYIMYVCMYDHI